MQALILAGGEGTRLRPLTLNTPKPIVPIANQPFLLRQIDLLKKVGITDIILSLNYQPSAIEKVLGDGSEFGVDLRYLIEPAPLGTAGAYKFAEEFLDTATIVLNGDILTDIDLQYVVDQHRKLNSIATIVLTPVENPAAYGLVELGNNFEVLRFVEKPKAEEIATLNLNTINAGIYIFEPNILNLIPKDEKYSFEYQLFPDLLKRKEAFHGFVADDIYWLDIGTPERYLQAHDDLMSGKIRDFEVEKFENLEIDENAEVDDKSVIGEGCQIKSGAKIINSVLGENVIIEEDCSISNSVIWDETIVENQTVILHSVIGKNSRIGKNVCLSKNSILGDNTILTDFSIS
ncbi:MAG: NDP-sugar synthase [Acidobacteriota bacterium]